VINNHILVGVGGDSLDVPGYLKARDPDTLIENGRMSSARLRVDQAQC
jgi:hypothetical protein